MTFLDRIYAEASKKKKKIILIDGGDKRVIEAAKILQGNNMCELILGDNLVEALQLLKKGKVDGVVGGARMTTADVLKNTFKIIGAKHKVSGAMLMIIGDIPYLFADCAVMPNPSSQDLAQIAIDSAKTFQLLTGEKPFVAMLSFSTKGSAKHEMIDKVIEATKIAKKLNPKLNIDGELQFDAAIDLEIAKKKLSKSPVAGKTNVFIFPDLNSANICYKAVRHFGKAQAIGPILQGLNKPVNDLSRGCTTEDIVDVTAITALQANQ